MVYFVGAGCGAPDLITVRGAKLLQQADRVIYAGSLVNLALLEDTKPHCLIQNSAKMTLEEVIASIVEGSNQNECIVRLHTGDPSLYGAIREQMDELDNRSIPYEVVPGVSSFCGAAAALHAEYTLPEVSQTLIITRMAGKTPVPERESLRRLAEHQTSMALFLSASLAKEVQNELILGGYSPNTPAAIVYKATWPDEQCFRCTIETLVQTLEEHHITKTALILVGDFLNSQYERSKLYDPTFSTEFRKASKE